MAFSTQAVHALKADIVDTEGVWSTDSFRIGFRVQGAFSESITNAIHTGAPTTFTFVADLYDQKLDQPALKVGERTLERTIQYDTLKRHYVVTEEDVQQIADSLPEAERLMTEVRGLTVAPDGGTVDPQATYYVLVKAELAEVELPFMFTFLRIFVQVWDFETRWTRIDLPRAQ